MRLLVAIADRCLGSALNGGAMATALHAFTKHGDASYVAVARVLLHEACAPLWIMLFRWVYEGEVHACSHISPVLSHLDILLVLSSAKYSMLICARCSVLICVR